MPSLFKFLAIAREKKFWEHRGVKHLLTGLMVCGECDGSIIAAGKDYLTSDHARNQGTCSNKRGIRRHLIEERVAHALR